MATFSVLLLTAPPAGGNAEAGGPFVKIDAREVLLKSSELFLNRENVKQIQIVFLPENRSQKPGVQEKRWGAVPSWCRTRTRAGASPPPSSNTSRPSPVSEASAASPPRYCPPTTR